MERQEFIERTGLTPTSEEYQQIESMYMSTGKMDKDIFCKQYKKHGESSLVTALFKETQILNGQLEERKNEIKNLNQRNSDMVDFLLERAQAFSDIQLLHKAIEIIGHKEVIIRKLSSELPLWDLDKDFLLEELQA